jgi:hypothetical protein
MITIENSTRLWPALPRVVGGSWHRHRLRDRGRSIHLAWLTPRRIAIRLR